MEKQEKNQLKNLLKKYLDSTSMDSLISVSEVINMLDDSNTTGGYTKGKFNPSPEDYLKVAGLHDKISGNNNSHLMGMCHLEKVFLKRPGISLPKPGNCFKT